VFAPRPTLVRPVVLAGAQRGALHRALRPWALALEALPHARALRWSLDVNPLEMG
jgi:primosomal protein N' (replication factor Y)